MDIECVRIGSVTYANKAKEILNNNGIRSKLKKISSEQEGCAYLLEMDKKFFERTVLLLREKEINFTRCDYH